MKATILIDIKPLTLSKDLGSSMTAATSPSRQSKVKMAVSQTAPSSPQHKRVIHRTANCLVEEDPEDYVKRRQKKIEVSIESITTVVSVAEGLECAFGAAIPELRLVHQCRICL